MSLVTVGLASLASASRVKVDVSNPTSGVQKVIKLLGDLKTKVEAETAQGAKDAEDMENECIESIASLEKDVSYGSEKAQELSATVENESAKADGYAVDVATFGPQIAKLQDELKVAGQVRADENKVFNGEEAELVESATMLTQAYSVLKRSLGGPVSLLQGSDDEMRKIVSALGAIVNAAGLDVSAQNKIKSLLQADDSLSLHQPQAIVKTYESKSGVILDAIEDMQEKTAEQLSKLRETEMDKKHQYELLVQDLSNQINTKEDMLAAAKQNEGDSRAKAGQASSQLSQTTEALEADKTQLADTKVDCRKAAEEWVARKASAEQEVVVLQKAIDILSGKFSLLQTSARGTKSNISFLARHRNYEQREKAAAILRQMGHKFNSFGLLQAAEAAQDDPFTKVRGLIKDLIMQLEEQAAAEAAKEGKCKADLASGERDVKVKTEQMKKYQTRLDSSTAKFEQLGTDVSELEAEVKKIGIDTQAWTKIRHQENLDNTATIKDAEESIEAINSAIGVLQEFYGTAALLQEGASSKQPKGESANVIVEYLQTAQEDFEKIRQETETAERTGKEDYEKDMQAAKVSLTKKKALIEGKTQERAGLKVAIGQVSDDLANATKAWEAATEYLKNKKEECSNKAMSYEERKKRREEEIAGLQEALEILSKDE